MRTLLPALLVISAAVISAQETSVRSDTEIPVELRTKIDTQSAKVGAKIEFHTTEAVLIGHNIVVPENATIIGRVEQAIDAVANSSKSVLRISITHLKWKNGEASLNAVIISVERTPAQEILMARGHHSFRDPPTFLKDIHIRAHLSRSAITEFYSDHPSFTVNKGLFFLLRQVDPDHDSTMTGSDNILDVGPED
jgi:hypothetical protein